MDQQTKKHFSMIRGFHLADFFTLANAACGVGAVFLTMRYLQGGALAYFYAAAAMAPLAFFFDWLDGNVARWRHEHSVLGRELDSLADVISFGVAPAVLAYAAGLDGGWDAAILIYFVCCGVSRLARFNVTAEKMSEGDASGKVKYFEGTPIPTSVVLTGVLAFAAGMRGGWDAVILIYFVCCGVSRLARFNVTAEQLSEGGDKVKYFEGTPIPTSVVLVGVLAWAAWSGRIGDNNLWGGAWTLGPWQLHPLALLFALSGTLMISKTLRIPKF